MEAKDMYVPSPYPPTKPPKKVLKKLLERNRWQCVGVEVSPSSPLSSKYWASKPFGLESNAIHSPNENIPLDIFRKGIEAVVEFYLNYK